jgi:DMSO/TMAO reductase YedYZ molybdopterin-dependent catalytic subunit
MKILSAFMMLAFLAVPAAAQPAAPKSLAVKLDGAVKMPASFTLAQLQAMPAVSVDVTYEGQGKSTWKGVALAPLIDAAGTVEEKGGGAYLRHMIVAKGTDGYASGIAIGEIDTKFEGKHVIIAYEKDGQPLDSLRLVVPGDAHAGRAVRDLMEITIN